MHIMHAWADGSVHYAMTKPPSPPLSPEQMQPPDQDEDDDDDDDDDAEGGDEDRAGDAPDEPSSPREGGQDGDSHGKGDQEGSTGDGGGSQDNASFGGGAPHMQSMSAPSKKRFVLKAPRVVQLQLGKDKRRATNSHTLTGSTHGNFTALGSRYMPRLRPKIVLPQWDDMTVHTLCDSVFLDHEADDCQGAPQVYGVELPQELQYLAHAQDDEWEASDDESVFELEVRCILVIHCGRHPGARVVRRTRGTFASTAGCR